MWQAFSGLPGGGRYVYYAEYFPSTIYDGWVCDTTFYKEIKPGAKVIGCTI